jgi:hypothetical protein
MLSPSLSLSFAMFVGFGTGRNRKKGMMLLWHAYIWTLWFLRNNKVFNDGIMDVDEAVESIKRVSWQWFIDRLATTLCLFYEWRWNPGVCFYQWGVFET